MFYLALLASQAASTSIMVDDASRRNARPGLAATDDGEVRAECGERLCRRQPNAIGGTRDQDLLVVHGTAIQRYGDARVTCPMVEDLTIDHGVSDQGSRRAPASSSSSSTHTPIGAFKGAAALGTRASTCIVARDLINALHYADGRGKKDFPPRGA